MSESEIALTKRLAELEGRVARDDAAKAVDALIAAGKAVPAQRDSLIGFRVGAPAQFTAWAKDLPVVVHMGEQGTAGGQDAEVLTEADFQAARDQNLDLDVMRAHKRAQAAATNV